MNRNLEREVPTKQEASVINDKGPTNSRRCAAQKNPRIVCVSRSHGGKDRHSKVSTIRGLRDRRVRLSVQTAIQLYDLQEKLGVNQPSKVVDWLLNAAKHEINKLPPLSIQVSKGKFVQLPQNIMVSHEIASPPAFQQGYTVVDKARHLALSSDMCNFVVGDVTTLPNSTYWNSDVLMKTKQEEKEPIVRNGIIVKGNVEEQQRVGMMSNDMPYASHHNWENAYPTHLGSHSFQVEAGHNFRSSRPFIPSLQPGSQQEMFSSMVNPSVFSSYMTSSTNFSLPNSYGV